MGAVVTVIARNLDAVDPKKRAGRTLTLFRESICKIHPLPTIYDPSINAGIIVEKIQKVQHIFGTIRESKDGKTHALAVDAVVLKGDKK